MDSDNTAEILPAVGVKLPQQDEKMMTPGHNPPTNKETQLGSDDGHNEDITEATRSRVKPAEWDISAEVDKVVMDECESVKEAKIPEKSPEGMDSSILQPNDKIDSLPEKRQEVPSDLQTPEKPKPESATVSNVPEDLDTTVFHVRWVNRDAMRMPIVTQNRNGACPMIAIVNVLLQRSQLHLTDGVEVVSGRKLIDLIGDCILQLTQRQTQNVNQRADLEKNINDAIDALPKLMTGLDVNVRFNNVSAFEFTPEFLVFDLLNIPLLHGWLVDTQNEEMVKTVGNSTYNQLVEKLLSQKTGEETALIAEALLLEQFLESTASQLTYEGLCELNAHLKDGELAVLFRNNHFSTLLKQKDELFILVTDWGFLNEAQVVWETLNCVDGDSHFVDSEFHNTPPKATGPIAPLPENVSPQQQIDHDLMVAMALEEEDLTTAEQAGVADTDRKLAMQLQQEEEQRAAGADPGSTGTAGGNSVDPNAAAPRRSSGDKKSSKCEIS